MDLQGVSRYAFCIIVGRHHHVLLVFKPFPLRAAAAFALIFRLLVIHGFLRLLLLFLTESFNS